MYKVFVNDSPIIITSSSKNENNFPVYAFNDISFDDIIEKLENKSADGVILYSTFLVKDWYSFLENIYVVPAAGGLVLNDK
jgi:hypothetical protein